MGFYYPLDQSNLIFRQARVYSYSFMQADRI